MSDPIKKTENWYEASDAFSHHQPAEMLDASTLQGILREDFPFTGNHYPFRFVDQEEYKDQVSEAGFEVRYLETIRRSYNDQRETFEHVVLEAKKIQEKLN